MKKVIGIIVIGLAAFVFVIGSWAVSVNNTLVSLDERVNAAKAQVENVYQRRADLIPNFLIPPVFIKATWRP